MNKRSKKKDKHLVDGVVFHLVTLNRLYTCMYVCVFSFIVILDENMFINLFF